MAESVFDGEIKKVEVIPFNADRDLTAVDHVLLSSSTKIDEVVINLNELKNQMREGKIDPQALTLRKITFPVTTEEVEAIQDRRKNQMDLIGTTFPFLDFDGQERIERMGYKYRFQPLGMIDANEGRCTNPSWRISVVDPKNQNREVNSNEVDNYFGINEFFNENFALDPDLKQGARLLHLIGLQEKHDI